jgi:hypothetical protein
VLRQLKLEFLESARHCSDDPVKLMVGFEPPQNERLAGKISAVGLLY